MTLFHLKQKTASSVSNVHAVITATVKITGREHRCVLRTPHTGLGRLVQLRHFQIHTEIWNSMAENQIQPLYD